MEFNEEEIKEIENSAAGCAAVGKLWSEYNRYKTDAGAKFYKSLYDCTTALSAELDMVHSGKYTKLRLLDSDSKIWKRVFSLLTNSAKIRVGLELNKNTFETIKQGKKIEEEAEMSITDKMANNSKK